MKRVDKTRSTETDSEQGTNGKTKQIRIIDMMSITKQNNTNCLKSQIRNTSERPSSDKLTLTEALQAVGLQVIERDYQGYRLLFVQLEAIA